ncbi:hypothetical protein [Hymenobacter rubripertinctus]|uniref:Uncharacterized protein n=1 Tax=Hymenobacter rubripertinctus TaxID=2029981 RepID=A0A418QXG3_9BACT|nr:hypothetical protein [Hymenobacter rubripertinctus]RIY09842.1 hypothetical protein D0T11_11795 [Hymenobacter rubripertinctus]
MIPFFRWISLSVCLLCHPVLAQQSPVQSIPLTAHETLGGLVQLANGNTVLFLSNSQSPDVRVQALQPNGQTAWQANLIRFQQVELDELRNTPKNASLNRKMEAYSGTLNPVEICSSGDNVYAIEVVRENVAQKQGKTGSLKAGQIMLQHLDGAGKLSKVSFMAPTTAKFAERKHLGWFGEGLIVYHVAADYNDREGTIKYFVEQYDIATRVFKRLPLDLPATPERTKMNVYYNDWGYLGHRPGQTYLFRRLRGHAKQDRFAKMPVEYQVLIVNNAGATTGGFTTTLNLEADTKAAYSSYFMPQLQEQQHVPRMQQRGREIIDEYRASTGGIGNFYLDYATGDVLIYGEFSREDTWGDFAGLFMRRYTAAGEVVQQTQFAYSKDMIKKHDKAFNGLALLGALRSFSFSRDPLSHDYEFVFAKSGLMGKGPGQFHVRFNSDMQFQTYSFLEDEPELHVTFVKPTWLYSGTKPEERFLPGSLSKQHAAYAQVASLAKLLKKDEHEYFLAPKSTGGALLVERQALLGGNLNVYTLQ